MKNSMRKIMIIIMVCSFFLINGCGEDSMSEEDLVDGRKMSGEQKLEEVEAGNFPLFWESTGQEELTVLYASRIKRRSKGAPRGQLLAGSQSVGGGAGKADGNYGGYVCRFSGGETGSGRSY